MNTGVTSDLILTRSPRGRRPKKLLIIATKLLVTGTCLWYVSRQVDFNQVLSGVPLLDFRWAAVAILFVLLQVPLLAERWCAIVSGLVARNERMTRMAMIAATAIGVFFAQVLPSIAGEGMRAWLLVRLGCDWRKAVTSVVIDKGVGVYLLISLGFIMLLLPSSLSALGGSRNLVITVYGTLLLTGALGLLLAPRIVPPLARWRYSLWFAMLAVDAHRVLLGPRGPVILILGCLVQLLAILVVWSLGRAQGLMLSASESAVLFTVMIGVGIVPISIGGWGLRELVMISLLGTQGLAPEKALLLSVSFGLAPAVASLT